MDLIKLAILPLEDAKRFKAQLATMGIEIFLDHNEQTCTRGCSVTVEVLGHEQDLEQISNVFQDNFKKLAQGQDVNWELMNSVFDPSQKKAICPACAFEFSTSEKECPDCGLVFSI